MKRVSKMTIGTSFDATMTRANALTQTVGEVGIIDIETGAAATGAASEKRVAIIMLCSDSDGRLYVEESAPIEMGSIQTYNDSLYSASTAKEQEIDVTGITTLVAADINGVDNVFELFVTDYNDYNYIIGRKRFEYVGKTGDTAAMIGTALALQITTDVSIPNISATSAAGVITVIGKAVIGSGTSNVINNFRADYEVLFNMVAGKGLYGVAVISTTVFADKGCGTQREVRKMEEVHKGYKGHLNRVIYPTSVNILYKSVNAGGYDLYVIEHKGNQYTETEGDVHFQLAHTVALNAGAGAAFALVADAVFANLK